MSFGISPWGTGPYGGLSGTAAALTVVAAWAISTHSVRVELSTEPIHVSEFTTGDALNPLSWSVVDTTTGRPLTVVVASIHDQTSVDLVTIEPLGDHLEEHLVTAVGLVSTDGNPLSSPANATFLGVVQTVDPVDSERADYRDRDIANPPFQVTRSTGYSGALQFDADGDLATEAGAPLIKKLVLRRMATQRGAFPHLPDYGVGLLEKEPIAGGGDLVALLREIEDQCRQEPDVEAAVARGSVDRSGVLIIQVGITAGGGASLNMRMGPVGGRLVEM